MADLNPGGIGWEMVTEVRASCQGREQPSQRARSCVLELMHKGILGGDGRPEGHGWGEKEARSRR